MKKNQDRKKTTMFFMTKENFFHELNPVYQRTGFDPLMLIQFDLELPFQLAFEHGFCVTYMITQSSAITISFLGESILKKNGSIIEYRTTIEATYVTSDEKEDCNEEKLNIFFDQTLSFLNNLIITYQIKTKDTDIFPITKEMFDPLLLTRTITIADWKEKKNLFMLHLNVPSEKEKLSRSATHEIVELSQQFITGKNPFYLNESILLSAKRHHKMGLYSEAVIYAQTCIEVFFRTLYSKMLEEEGAELKKIEQNLENYIFMKVLKTEFHSRLGGFWDPKNSVTIIGKWHEKTYVLRNRIIHAGYMPTFSEADNAIISAYELRNDVVASILRSGKYKILKTYFTLSDL